MPRLGSPYHIYMKKKDWFKIKKYPHIGLPLKIEDRYKWIEKYITSPIDIKDHSFLPFIHKTSKVRKFRKKYSSQDGQLIQTKHNGKAHNRVTDIKQRELYYASHLDSLIFSYYAEQLSIAYEDQLTSHNLTDVVNAYRSVPLDSSKVDGPNKCNIDFAEDVFDYIKKFDQQEFAVICFDIKSFFDNLDHKVLLKAWCNVMSVDSLPPDHFNIFKNITRYSYVDIVDIFKKFQNNIFIQKRNSLGEPLPIKRKKISKIKFLRNQHAVAFCTKKEFFKYKNELLKSSKTVGQKGNTSKKKFGIPQGSPISSILANIYLFEFDKKISDYLSNGGIYRRYSDDMVVVCNLSQKTDIQKIIYDTIAEFKLEIQKTKTQIFHFKRDNGALVCGQEFQNGVNWNKNFIYLGFEFDGTITLLKSASISGYYRKMKRTIKRAKMHSLRKFNKNRGEIFKAKILKKFSYKGAHRRRKWMWDDKTKKFQKSDHYDWGNFLSYAYKASESMADNKIKNQLKRHWNIINRLLKY